jgi:DNA-directed RNA polymerase specialized sigma24 family protein
MRQTSTLPHSNLPSFFPGDIEPVYTRDELVALIDWYATTTRLMGYANSKIWRHGAAAARYALQAPDLVQEAITSWLEERRIFDAGTESAFFGFLCGVVDSLLSHDKEKTIRRGRQLSISKDGGDETTIDEVSEGRIRAKGDFERDFLFRDNLERFIDSLEPDLATYARALVQAPDSSAEERALALNITVADVRNFDRRLHRWARQWRTQ